MRASSSPFFAPDEVRRPEAHRELERDVAIHVPDLCCRARGRRAEAVLRGLPGVRAATVRWREERADVRVESGRTTEGELTSALARAGYRAAQTGGRAVVIEAHGPALTVATAAVASALLLATLEASHVAIRGAFFVQVALAAIAVAAAVATLGARVIALTRRGILDRDALALLGAVGAVALGARDRASGWSLAAAGAIAASAIACRFAEEAFGRRAMEHAALDAEAKRVLARIAETVDSPDPESWDDAVVRGIFTATLGCASFALVTHACAGEAPFGPRALGAAIAVLVAASPSAILAAGPFARAIAVRRAHGLGARVRDPAALEVLGAADLICLRDEAAQDRSVVHALAALGLVPLRVGDAAPAATAIGARASVQVAIGSAGLDAARAPIVIDERRADALPEIVALSRALRRVERVNAGLVITYNAAVIPAATLGRVPPCAAAFLALIVTFIGLANTSRLFPRARTRGGRRGAKAQA